MLNKHVLNHKKIVTDFLTSIGIDVNMIGDEKMMLTAFVHKSFASDFNEPIEDHERLEFLGDSVLSLVVNTYLFHDFPEDTEAHLTMRKISLVRQEHLTQVAHHIGLDQIILVGRWEEKMWGRQKDSVLTDSLEALIGRMYIDLGLEVVTMFVKKYIYRDIGHGDLGLKSYKSLIQEYFQKKHCNPPVYADQACETDQYGNITMFESKISCDNQVWPTGRGTNKKKAQEHAAKLRYEQLVA
jgi:ribonuclease-3